MTKEETKYCENCKRCQKIFYDWTWKVKCNKRSDYEEYKVTSYCKYKKERK